MRMSLENVEFHILLRCVQSVALYEQYDLFFFPHSVVEGQGFKDSNEDNWLNKKEENIFYLFLLLTLQS